MCFPGFWVTFGVCSICTFGGFGGVGGGGGGGGGGPGGHFWRFRVTFLTLFDQIFYTFFYTFPLETFPTIVYGCSEFIPKITRAIKLDTFRLYVIKTNGLKTYNYFSSHFIFFIYHFLSDFYSTAPGAGGQVQLSNTPCTLYHQRS